MISSANQLEFRHLHYFLTLADELHFRKAAEKLYITQSALSQQIKQLENILGQEVFTRINKKIQLNEAGNLLYKEASIIQSRFHLTLKNLDLLKSGGIGSINIGFVASAMESVLSKILNKLNSDQPQINFNLLELSNQIQMDEIAKGNLDIGFVRTNQIDEQMEIQCVNKEPFVLVVPSNHPVTRKKFKNLNQFKEESFILFPNNTSPMFYQQILNMCTEHGFVPKITHRTIHAPSIFYLVEMNMGISVIPKSLAVNETKYKVRFISLEHIPYHTSLFAVWNKNSNNSTLPLLLNLLPKI